MFYTAQCLAHHDTMFGKYGAEQRMTTDRDPRAKAGLKITDNHRAITWSSHVLIMTCNDQGRNWICRRALRDAGGDHMSKCCETGVLCGFECRSAVQGVCVRIRPFAS